MPYLFGENQLSPGSIGISPLPTPHRHPFQRMCVRTSKAFYGSFILDMGRSPGFGPAASDFRPLKTRFPYGCSPTGASPRRSPQLAGPFYKKYATQGFRFSFTPLPGSFSPFPHGTIRYRSLGSI